MHNIQIKEIISNLGGKKAPLLQVLLAVQDNNDQHYISDEDINVISKEMQLSRCRVYSTTSFYSELSLSPRGKNIIRICTNSPCENSGKEELHEKLKEILEINIGETTQDGKFTLESVNCLGACYMSPAIKINDRLFGEVTGGDLAEILKTFDKEDISHEIV